MSHQPLRPPRLARWLVARLTPRALRDPVEGDLLEGFLDQTAREGPRAARRWYWRQVLSPDTLILWRSERSVRDGTRTERAPMVVRDLVQDFRYAVRTLWRQPAFAAVALVTLAVGIGANTAVFSVVNGVLLRPLPYPDADGLVMVFRTVPRYGFARSTSSYPDFADWRAAGADVAQLAAYAPTSLTSLSADGAERWVGYRATADLSPVLGVAPAVGRWFTAAEDQPGAPPVIVLSHSLWQSRFAGDPGVTARAVTLNGEPYLIIGVMPPGFAFPSDAAQFWTPLRGDAARLERDANFLAIIGRLAPGATAARAQTTFAALAARIDTETPGANEGYGIFVEPRHAFVVRNARDGLYVFLGAVVLVLLVACANVMNLLLARGAAREREIGVRRALGAGRGRLARQLLTEGAVLAVAGGGLGVVVAVGVLRLIVALGAGQVPRLDEVGVDGTMLVFTAAVALACGVAFGVVGALANARHEMTVGTRARMARSGGRAGRRLQRGLVVTQVAMAVTLSLAAGLLGHSFLRLTNVEPGFEPRNLVAARVAPTIASPDLPPEVPDSVAEALVFAAGAPRRLFFERVRPSVSAIPGVDAVALAYDLPFGGRGFSRPAVPEGRTESEDEAPAVSGNVVAGDYFRTLGIPLLRGRNFEASDGAGSPPVAIVNEALADGFWPGADPIGKRMRLGGSDNPWTTVVGVVGDVSQRSLAEGRPPMFYQSIAQSPWVDGMYLVVRSSVPSDGVVAALRRVVADLDPSLPLTDVAVSTELIAESVREPRFRAVVLAIFGLSAVIVAVAGVYGVVAYAVSVRRRELGIRIALGAAPTGLVAHVLRDGISLALVGLAIGVGGAVVLSRFLRGLLYGIGPLDAATFGVVVTVVAAVTAVACYLPARRAAAADPLESMRME